ncbi:hypothetical protein K2P47_04615 [Patescibacteria group bacterium]|nr:hypothetical protein [Patescibacteria group bacterium]
MPESPSSSFIPKRGIGKKPTVVRKNNFVLISIISYALFVSAPLASAAVFIYERHTQNQFNKAVINLDQAIESFKEEDLKRVTEFNDRLTITKNLLSSHVSIEDLLRRIESATAQTVVFKSMDITRVDKSTISVSGQMSTEKFDGALFQRAAFDADEIINSPVFSDVKLTMPILAGETVSSADTRVVEFKVGFQVAAADIVYSPVSQQVTEVSPVMNDTVDTAETSSSDTTETEGAVSNTNI